MKGTSFFVFQILTLYKLISYPVYDILKQILFQNFETNCLRKVMSMNKRVLTAAHIAIWVLGTAFLITGAFHNNVWFDESYSVGIINHNLFEICAISAADVHPPFYYILLKLYSLIFGNSLLALRLFSVLFQSLLAGLGFTYIRKDFGEKVGFWYTTLMFLFATSFKYASEIRMYTLAPFLVTLMCIYAYRFYKSNFIDKKYKVLFLVFSILSAYTHYYGLAAAGAVNFLFLIMIRKDKTNNLMPMWIKMAAIQGVSYLFGFYCLVTQTFHVVGDYWITMKYPDFIYKTLSFFLVGDVPEDAVGLTDITSILYDALAVVFWGVCILFFVLDYRKNQDKTKPSILVLKVIGLIIGFYFTVSLIRPLYYVRYLTVLSGLIVLFLAFAFDKVNIRIKPLLLILLTTVLVFRVLPLYETNYSDKNKQIDTFFAENIKEGDIIVSDNIGLVAVLAVKYPDTKMYFYNRDGWTVEKAYEAYMPCMSTVREISEICESDGRVWVLNNYFSGSICDEISNKSDKKIIQRFETFVLPYHELEFGFTLMQ